MQKSIHFIEDNTGLSLGEIQYFLSYQHDNRTALDLTRDYILNSTSEVIQKKGLEFLYMNGYYEELQLLIKKNLESMHTSNKTWGAIYQIMVDCCLKKDSPQNLLERLQYIHSNEAEIKCLVEFTRIYIYFSLRDYEEVGSFLVEQPYLFEAIEDDFILSYFKLRLHQSLFIYYWIRNELIIARKYAYRALTKTNNEKIIASLHNNLGLSYIFDHFTQGKFHLTKALKIAKKNKLHNLIHIIEQQNIPFLCAHFKKTYGISSVEKSEQAHIEIAKGNYSKAVELLRNLSMDNPFTLYYMGVATEDKHMLYKSYNYFIEKESNYFFSRLPLRALKDVGVG
ncbi:AimR family lysis-lysogeny pheromone receptor [Virgibacillus alimentarius]|uniref:Tetratricopeptide (TPR) repeat protein n=1 Tax=Virgibacillus alimentarius TaxID=698769 RepID=A0ABS4S7A8_9BACI|nr:AimR family lysis-lysogeny pheromone receptor [Virgibacillus alimentarius]MBP2257385.1 tetratricopeptide (TPR) repeat protein [Virgibacillus alimentarius]